MTTLEKKALRLYPEQWIQTPTGELIDKNAPERAAFIKGYEERQKDTFFPKWRIVDDYSEFKEHSDYDRFIIAEDGGVVILYDRENELYMEIGDIDSSQDDDMIEFTNARKQCPFRDAEDKFCKKKREDILKYASDCLPEYCVCDGKCDWMTKHDMDEMKEAYDEI